MINLTYLLLSIPIGIIVAFLILWMAFASCYTILLIKSLSKNNKLSEYSLNISVQPCNNGRQTKNKTNIANYSYAIKYCFRKRVYFFDVLRILRTGYYQPSESENLSDYHNHRRSENNKDRIIGMIDSPFPNEFDEDFHSNANVSQADGVCQPKVNDALVSKHLYTWLTCYTIPVKSLLQPCWGNGEKHGRTQRCLYHTGREARLRHLSVIPPCASVSHDA